MYQVKNFTDSKNVKKIAQLGGFSVIEYQRDLRLFPDLAMTAYFCSQMNVRKRQLVCEMSQLTGHHVSRSYAVDARQRQRHNRY